MMEQHTTPCPEGDAVSPTGDSTKGDALRWAVRLLSAAGLDTPRLDAEVLLAHVLGAQRAELYSHVRDQLSPQAARAFTAAIRRRRAHEPVAYLIGQRAFYDLQVNVSPSVLIPRPETEQLLELALEWCARAPEGALRMADVGTGSGALAVALARRVPRAYVVASDISPAALAVAAENVARYDLGGRVGLLCADLLSALIGPLHVVLANLPYISRERLAVLPPDVADYEPRLALDGGDDGLALIMRLLAQAPERLATPGLLLLEIDDGQGQAVADRARQCWPAATVAVLPDYAGLERVVRIETRAS